MGMGIQLVYASKYILFSVITFLLLQATSTLGKPRDQTVRVICGKELEHNTTAYVPNFFGSMEKVRQQIGTSGFGTAGTGTGPDASYGLAQCHGDLSSLECVLCHSQARTMLPQCFPFNGGRAFIDGCFLRFENYSFFDEYKGPEDTAICGNFTQNDPNYRQAAKEAVMQVVDGAPDNRGFAKARMAVAGMANESAAYALGQCWRSLNRSSCSTCLQIASASMLRCLPRSEARALNTGCFMRYSNTDFLNQDIKNSSRGGGMRTELIVSVLSSVVVLIIGLAIGTYIWKRRYIQKKRKGGSTDVKKLAKTLQDSNLEFKYSTLEKATNNFSLDNKIGQGGFGSVYKGTLSDGREIAVKRFFFDNRHRAADFYNEVNMISSVEHKNLVRLLGCSCSGPESLLVYEFLPNKSLDRFIFGTIERLFDPSLNLQNHYNKKVQDEVVRVVHIGLLCIQEIPSLRPTMSKVLRMLTMEEEHLPPPTKPPFMDEMTMELDDSCKYSRCYSNTEGSSTATIGHSSFYPR
ncbi:hypothetical protein Csa_018624 [Cucumis sativus]|nr:hypothetical protein Csa_018624 [Cucumis sativus]